MEENDRKQQIRLRQILRTATEGVRWGSYKRDWCGRLLRGGPSEREASCGELNAEEGLPCG